MVVVVVVGGVVVMVDVIADTAATVVVWSALQAVHCSGSSWNFIGCCGRGFN